MSSSSPLKNEDSTMRQSQIMSGDFTASMIGDNSFSHNQVKKNLWHSLLETVGSRRDMPQAHILVLGNRGCGKRSLIKQLNKPFLKGNAINKFDEFGSDYANFDASFIYMRDLIQGSDIQNMSTTDDSNEKQRINVWMISSQDMGHMISTILTPKDLEYTFAIIMPDMEQPWNIMD